MKVSDVMQKHVDSVPPEATILEVARFIFGRGVNGVPVTTNKKIVGFVTERDILNKFYPTVEEYMEDPVHSSNFEEMEQKVSDILSLPVEKIMSKGPVTVSLDTPLLEALSRMFVKKVGRLPVVDAEKKLLGMISKNDIFKALVGRQMPYVEDEEYHDWIARHYDIAIGWESRLPREIPDLVKLFKKEKVEKVLDIGCGTGEHAIALAKKGFKVVGIESSLLMYREAKNKWKSLSDKTKKNVTFLKGSSLDVLKTLDKEFGAVILMGNTLAHNPHAYKQIVKELDRVLVDKHAIVVVQLINFEKALKINNTLFSFEIKRSRLAPDKEHAFFWFYDPPKPHSNMLILNASILDLEHGNWTTRGMNKIYTVALPEEKLRSLFSKIGFVHFSFYGSKGWWGRLLGTPFNKLDSDWMTMVAKR